MIELAENVAVHFGAKYVAEDTASYILYRFDRSVLDGRPVPMDRFARFLGLDVRCEYITGDCTRALGVAAFEPQRIYLQDGALDLSVPTAVAERDIIERGECGLYNFTLALLCAETLFYGAKHGFRESGQLSFGLDSVVSQNSKRIVLEDAADEIWQNDESAAGFALKLAMPKNAFKRQTVELFAYLGVNRRTLDAQKHLPFILEKLSQAYNVPEFAVLARMKELNL